MVIEPLYDSQARGKKISHAMTQYALPPPPLPSRSTGVDEMVSTDGDVKNAKQSISFKRMESRSGLRRGLFGGRSSGVELER
jgi:hypothetical protein